ncbi:hypothetical protein EMMF5_003601 [Cystobasidiomycetes sp. EMM_F5]
MHRYTQRFAVDPKSTSSRPDSFEPSPILAKLQHRRNKAEAAGSAGSTGSSRSIPSRVGGLALRSLTPAAISEEYERSSLDATLSHIRHSVTPTSSRSVSVSSVDAFAKQYRRLSGGIVNANNLRNEQRLQARYEKPKYMRQRLRSARHRRRFAEFIARKVSAVMRAKHQGM